MERIGIVGLTDVGQAVAVCLTKAGIPVCGYRTRGVTPSMPVVAGATVMALPADVGEATSIVVIDVDDQANAEEVLFDLGGLGETLASGGLIIDASVTSGAFRRRADARLARFDIRRIDAARTAEEIIHAIASEIRTRGTLEGQPLAYSRAASMLTKLAVAAQLAVHSAANFSRAKASA
jgi:3-hydroxyisobutyrate dehydrogenase-like beta-hydroxyacid dehydrogenase